MPRTAINCRYLSYTLPGKGGKVVRLRLPLLHIRLSSNGKSITTIGLVDSGSTSTFVPLEIAEMLELPIEKQESAVGAGGRFQNTIRRVNIELLKGSKAIAKFPNFPSYVPTEADRIPYTVLGRDSVFQKYDVTFREHKQRVVMRGPPKK